jgi:hypothetical protein
MAGAFFVPDGFGARLNIITRMADPPLLRPAKNAGFAFDAKGCAAGSVYGWSRADTITGAGAMLERTVQFYAEWVVCHERPHVKQIKRIVSET